MTQFGDFSDLQREITRLREEIVRLRGALAHVGLVLCEDEECTAGSIVAAEALNGEGEPDR